MAGGREGHHDFRGAVGGDDPVERRDIEVRVALEKRDLVLELDGDLAGEGNALGLLRADRHLAEVDDPRQLDVVRGWVRVDGHHQVLTLIAAEDLHADG